MTISKIQNSITELGAQIVDKAKVINDLAMDMDCDMETVKAAREELEGLQARMDALKAAKETAKAESAERFIGFDEITKEEKPMENIRASREYAHAWAHALLTGSKPGRDFAASEHEVLYKALAEDGTAATGAFLIPVDVDNQITELKRAMNPLANVFNVEMVSSDTGWRVVDSAITKGMTVISAQNSQVPTDDEPAFVKVPFNLSTYGLIIPVSAELAQDEAANLFPYISRWFARKAVATENALLESKLPSSGTSISSDPLKGIKTALNLTLDPAISNSAAFICDQAGFAALDELVDNNGRPLLQPDVTNASMMRIMGRPVHVITGSTGVVYVGDFKAYATLFSRMPLEIVSTDIGGAAFSTNSVQIRGIARYDAQVCDAAAAVKLTL